jgi:hypothetical protein
MGICNDRRRPMAHNRTGKFRRADQTAFQMNVRVDQTGANDAFRYVDLLDSLVCADSGNPSIGYRDVAF